MLRFPQLDCELRNGAGVGGGIVVGLLPIVSASDSDSVVLCGIILIFYHLTA